MFEGGSEGSESMADKLTIKQEKYAQGLFAGLSQREAYKQAYNCTNMQDKTVDEEACKLAALPKISTRVDELIEEVKTKNIVTKEWVLNNLKVITERCMQAEPVLVREGNEWVESGEYRFDSSGANKSLELIGKHLKLFTEKVEHSGELGVVIVNDIPKQID